MTREIAKIIQPKTPKVSDGQFQSQRVMRNRKQLRGGAHGANIGRSSNVIGAFVLTISDSLKDLESRKGSFTVSSEGLVHLSHCAHPSIESLSNALGLSHSGAVRLADRMERDGLATRRPAAVDRRSVAVKLTRKGSARVASILERRSMFLTQLLQHAGSSEECKTFVRVAERVLKRLTVDDAHLYRSCRMCDFAACNDCPAASAIR